MTSNMKALKNLMTRFMAFLEMVVIHHSTSMIIMVVLVIVLKVKFMTYFGW